MTQSRPAALLVSAVALAGLVTTSTVLAAAGVSAAAGSATASWTDPAKDEIGTTAEAKWFRPSTDIRAVKAQHLAAKKRVRFVVKFRNLKPLHSEGHGVFGHTTRVSLDSPDQSVEYSVMAFHDGWSGHDVAGIQLGDQMMPSSCTKKTRASYAHTKDRVYINVPVRCLTSYDPLDEISFLPQAWGHRSYADSDQTDHAGFDTVAKAKKLTRQQ